MHAIRTAIAIAWILFWVYWLVSASRAKESRGGRRWRPVGGAGVVAVIVLLRVLGANGVPVHSIVLGVIGSALFVIGIALAVWARVHLGSNWGCR